MTSFYFRDFLHFGPNSLTPSGQLCGAGSRGSSSVAEHVGEEGCAGHAREKGCRGLARMKGCGGQEIEAAGLEVNG